ncbi:MAG: helix-turn-helix domain-containing protein [Candidatus Thorarchaeota archaeon]|nr:helix-turn-helix domain-containing protein [Candidatus Thorarchaeota archaeon]
MVDNQDREYEDVLKGKTLKVYIRLLESDRPWTARELQRDLGLSSPSLSLYHLNKLVDSALVEVNREGLYTISKIVRVGALRYFFRFGRRLIPRFLFYAAFFVSVFLASLILLDFTLHPVDILFILVMVISTSIFFFETYWFWKHGLE